MNLKIAYISDERFPSIHTDTQQVMKTMDALGRNGVHVDFIQPRMLRHLTKSKTQRKKEICKYYNIEGNFNIRDILFWPATDIRIEKLFHGFLAPLKVRLSQYDAVYTRNLIPLTLASRLRMPVLFETYRALPKTDPWAWKVVALASKTKRFLGISTHSEYSRQIMIDAGISEDMVRAIPNGFDPNDFSTFKEQNEARKELGLDRDAKIVVYTGQIREDKGIDSLLDLAEECHEITMLIVGGKQQEVDAIKATAEQRHLKNVQVRPQVSIGSVPLYLAAANILILPPSSTPIKHATVLPMKTFTYLAAGKPIVAPDLPDTKGVLKRDSNALLVQPDVPHLAAEAVKSILNNTELATRLAAKAKEDSQNFTWDGRAKNVIKFIEHQIQIK